MEPTNRLALAKQAYESALRDARAQSTPHTWARLLRAAQNIREAKVHAADTLARRSRR